MNIMRFIIKTIAVLILFSGQVSADNTLHGASDLRLLQAACPSAWQNIDSAIPSAGNTPTPPTSITWANTADKDDFMLFQSNFIISSTLNNQTAQTKADDPLLVASECIKRHNPVLNAYMNKDVGAIPLLRKIVNIGHIIMLLLL